MTENTRFAALRWLSAMSSGVARPDLEHGGPYPVIGAGGVMGHSSLSNAEPGDVAVGRVGTVGSVRVIRERSWLTDNVLQLRPSSKLESRFLGYALASLDLSPLISTTAQPLLTGALLGGVRIPVLSRELQIQVADFVDAQTAKIDALIGKQDQLIETLAERLDGHWSDVVSGMIERFPSVPLRRVIVSIVDGPFGSSLTSAHYSDQGAGVVRLGNIGIDEFKLEDRAYVPFDYAKSLSAHAVQPGDVVVAGLGDEKMPLGRAAIVPNSFGAGIVKADCYRVRPGARVSAVYLAWILSSPQSRTQFRALSRGSTRQRLNTQVVRDVILPLPPLDTQTEVVEKFHDVRRSNALLKAKAREMIDVLKERRQALISAAVTGKIDVRGLT